MLFRISLLLAVSLYGSCMEMRETVERTVMVRTSGSDLQPAATGYIYKKKNDGEESVIEMGESEVMEQLAKYYKPPKSFIALSPAAKDLKESEENKDDSKKDGRVIPVSEESEEKVDGLADDDFKKILEKYGVNFDDHKNYDHYSRGLGGFDDGYYHGYGDDSKENKNSYKNNHHYGSGGSGDYHNGKYERYTHTQKESDEEEKKKSHDYKENPEHKLDKQNDSEAENNKRGHGRFQKPYDNDEKDRKYYDHDDGIKFAFYKYDRGNKYHGDDQKYRHDSHETGDHDSETGKTNTESGSHGANNSAEEQDGSSDEKQRGYGSQSAQTYGKSFSFEIKH